MPSDVVLVPPDSCVKVGQQREISRAPRRGEAITTKHLLSDIIEVFNALLCGTGAHHSAGAKTANANGLPTGATPASGAGGPGPRA